MSRHQMPAAGRVSRRSALGLLGAVPIAATGVAALAGRADAATASDVPPSPVPVALRPGGPFDRMLAQQAAKDQFSGTVLISHRGAPVLTRSYGMADKQKKLPNQAGTIFGLASMTKLFTATAIVQLAEQGKLELSGTLGSYLPGWPAKLNGITIHQLLTHTSGMADYHSTPAYKQQNPQWNSADQVMDGITGIIKDSPLLFTPGTSSTYSNSGYVTLGAIVGQVTGKSYAHYYDYVRSSIFARAGMTRSDFYTRPQLSAPDIARSYALQPDGSRKDVSGSEYIGTPAGNAYSTAPDMIRYARALFGGQLFSRPWAELMTSPKYPGSTGPGGDGGQGGGAAPTTGALGGAAPSALQNQTGAYGAIAVIFGNQRIVTIGGGGPGTGESTNIDMYPDLDWDAVILSNYDNISTTALTSTERQAITQQAH